MFFFVGKGDQVALLAVCDSLVLLVLLVLLVFSVGVFGVLFNSYPFFILILQREKDLFSKTGTTKVLVRKGERHLP